MNYDQLIGKVLADKNSRKLGLCVDIRKSLVPGNKGDELLITMIVKVERALRDPFKVEVKAGKILKIEGIYAWLDTTKDEFKATIRNARKVKSGNKSNKKPDLAVLKNYRPPPQQRL